MAKKKQDRIPPSKLGGYLSIATCPCCGCIGFRDDVPGEWTCIDCDFSFAVISGPLKAELDDYR